EQLAHDLADLYNHRVPSEIRKLLRREKVVNKVLQNALEESGLADWLDSPLDVKILVAIRSDKFNELDRLTPYLPEIMLNSRILNPLSRDQAADAIRMPAEMEGDFPTPAFRYAPEAEQKLLEYLTDNQSKAVEGFQLQIICRNIEDKVASFADDPTKLEEDDRLEIKKLSGEGPQFEVADLDADFGDILRRYYNQQIRSLGDREKQLVARTLIEEELIADDRRVSLDHAILTQKVDEDLLKKLVDSRLIRREANTLGGFSYEISHDTLLDPILEARAERRMIEEANREREEARQAAADRQQEYERLKEKQAKDLAQARAETAELAKQRALQAQKTERRNKYFVLTLLIMVLIISGIGFSWWLTASWSYREIQETNSLLAKTNEKLIDAQKELEVQNEYLVDSLGFSSQRLEALRNELKISPSSEQRIYRRNAAFQDLISHLADTLLDYPGMREGRVPSGEYILERGVPIIRLHVFRPNEFAMQEDAQEMVEKVAAVLQKTPTFEIEVQSHTDQIGPAYNNIQNSVTRGMAVMEIFRAYFEEGEQGLRLNLAAKGESMPLRGGTRAQNRRIDLVLKQN
ncbi:MAG: OmpA family protein, partial [Bacteroidota bacterium]